MDNNFYVYIYLDPMKPGVFSYGEYTWAYEPFYVGKGKGNRYRKHIQPAYDTSSNLHKKRRIEKIQKQGLDPIIYKIQENLSEQKAWDLEFQLINLIGRRAFRTGPLTNIQDGGSGGACYGDSLEKMAAAHLGKNTGSSNPRYKKSQHQILIEKYGAVEGEKRYSNYLNKQRENMIRRWKDPEYRKQMTENHKSLIGDKNPMKGKSTYQMMLEKYGPEEGEKKFEEYREKLRAGRKKMLDNGWENPAKGKSRTFSKEHLQHIKEAQQKRRAQEKSQS